MEKEHEPRSMQMHAETDRGGVETPDRVEIVYRQIDGLHVFEAPAHPGLHSVDAVMKTAFEGISDAVTAYMRTKSGDTVRYKPEISYLKFIARLNATSSDNFGEYRKARSVIVDRTSAPDNSQHAMA